MNVPAPHPAASAYEAQLRIRREGEERNTAQQDLNLWLSDLKSAKNPNSTAVNRTTTKGSGLVAVGNTSLTFEEERRRGNDFFAKGKYQEAIQCYTRCIGHQESSSVVYSNRAMTHLKLKNWINAEADASEALSIDPNHSKSYQRRCVSRISLGKLRAAMMDAYAAEDCLSDRQDTKSFREVRELQQKVQRAMVEATLQAPRRKIGVQVIE